MFDIEIKKTDIIKPLSFIQSIVDKKALMTITNNVFLSAENNNLYIEATDLEISYNTKIPCLVKTSGALTINAKKIYELIKEFPFEDILIQEQDNLWVKIGNGNNIEFKLGSLPIDDFPRFKTLNTTNSIKINSKILQEMIEKTIYSTSTDETKYNLCGILFEKEKINENTTIRMVSSDGHRLNLIEKTIETNLNDEKMSFIIPRKGSNEIKNLTEKSDEIILGQDGKFCFAITERDFLSIRLIDAKFPNYKAILPTEKNKIICFDKNNVLSSLKRISILLSDTDSKGVKFIIRNNEMEIESLEKEFGDAKEIIPLEYNGEDIVLALNVKYIFNILSILKSQLIEMTIKNSSSPIIIKGNEDEGFTGLIMPLTNYDI